MRVFVLLVLFPRLLWGAACCGSNSLFPSLISGDDHSQLTATTSYSNVIGDAPVSGAWVSRRREDFESRTTFRVDFASLLSDRWQWGVYIPVVHRFRGRNGSQVRAIGLGDPGLVLGFEALPQWTYSRWRPKGIVFVSVGIPLGRSSFEAVELYQVDVRGRGFWNLSGGALLQKTFGSWDTVLLIEVHRPFERAWQGGDQGEIRLMPSAGMSGALGVGRSWQNLRLGAFLTANYEGPLRTMGILQTVGAAQASFPVLIQVSYLVADRWSFGAIYTDTSIFPGRNGPVNRAVGAMVQTRWER